MTMARRMATTIATTTWITTQLDGDSNIVERSASTSSTMMACRNEDKNYFIF
jgi:hypothetical protein